MSRVFSKQLQNEKRGLQVFCKSPDVDSVKTRMYPTLGVSGARKLARELAGSTIRSMCSGQEFDLHVYCSPSSDDDFFRSFGHVTFRDQEGEDLGARMGFALTAGLLQWEKVVLIGTDCPLITPSYIRTAFDRLDSHDVVLGPVEDGGYGLIGIKESVPDIFEGIEWSTDQVLSETCRRLNEAGIGYSLLPLIWDVDRPEDLPRYYEWLENT